MKILRVAARIAVLYGFSLVSTAQTSTPLPSIPATTDLETSLPSSLGFSIYPTSLQKVQVLLYSDTRSADSGHRYYIEPYVFPEWNSFQSAVQKSCDGQSPNYFTSVELVVQLANLRVNEEIVSLAKKNASATDITLETLFSYPFALLRLDTIGVSDPEIPRKTRWRYPRGGDEILTGVMQANSIRFLDDSVTIPIRDTCEQLVRIARSPQNILGTMYSSNNTVQVDILSISYGGFARDAKLERLFRDETAAGSRKVTMRGSSGGVGLNLGGVFGGASDSSQVSESKDSRHRAISGSLVQEAATEYSRTLVIQRRSEIERAGIHSDELPQLLANFVLETAKEATASFRKISEDQWEVVIGQVTRTISASEVEELLKSSGNPQLVGANENQASVKVKAVEVSGNSKQNASFTDNRGIEWSRNDKAEWIPTSAKLELISANALEDRASAIYEDVVVKRGTSVARVELRTITSGSPTSTLADALRAMNFGPKKLVTPIVGGAYRTESYWAKAWRGDYACLGTPEVKDGFTKVGGQDTELQSWGTGPFGINPRAYGCKPAGHCDSHGESCRTYYRAAGCVINNEWLDWWKTKQNAAGQVVRDEDICREPVDPALK